MTKFANTTTTSQLIERVVGRMVDRRLLMAKNASDQSFDSVSNMEDSSPEQYVRNKLQHKGMDYEKSTVSSFGLQQTRDLLAQGPNSGPLPDKASSDQDDDRSSKDDIQDNPLYDVFETPEEPTDKISDPGTQGDPVSEKLQLKKDASALLTRMDDMNRQGQHIIDYLMQLTVHQKQADGKSVTEPTYTQDELLTEAMKLASADTLTQIKTALFHAVDDAIYAAEAAALKIRKEQAAMSRSRQAGSGKQASDEEPTDEQAIPTEEPPAPATPSAPPAMSEEGGDPALQAMNDPAPMGDPEGEPPLSEEEAQALMAQSLQENGVDPNMFPEGEPGGELPGAGEPEISPEELAAFEAAMQQAGITPEEVDAAIAELQAEEAAGITPEQGIVADDEAAKTGHYKFASFIKRPSAKTAQQEQRAAMIRGAVRDFVYGPATRNFN